MFHKSHLSNIPACTSPAVPLIIKRPRTDATATMDAALQDAPGTTEQGPREPCIR